MTDTTKGFTLTRNYDATPEQIWQAWTDPDQAAQWWHPAGLSTPRDSVSIDARVGGLYTYTMVDDASGEEYPTGGEYREVVPNEKLVFTWGDPSGDPDDAMLVTVSIEPLGELTRLVFDLRGADGMRGDDSFYDGWDGALDELAQLLGQTPVAG
ncbi:SRPBCC family protein [Herbiconiux daphne]|uniref:SRPBCC domain-containing protein n=1 Tax=Herbiconiux daphne TaxID=2970914 RepID=A0ABT2H2E1_9MICO|nr:SRPBCC domain-containing protein [Herbiconiux daphne]MCS5734116.1 SRPBCC domain-containing protein [Herbiconiux daphne]